MTFRVAALLLVVAAMALVREFAGEGPTRPTMALALGFALIAALMLGEAAERLRMPRLSGYLIFGLLCGPYVLNLITAQMARELQFVNGLAIALIAIIAGLEINIARLKSRLRSIAAISAATLAVMYATLGAIFMVAWPWLPIAPEATGLERVSMVLVLTAIVASFSPTVTIAVIAESRARGPFSELVLAVVVLADLALILGFTLVMQLARTVGGNDPETAGLMVRLLWEIAGSLAFGALLGSVFAMYLRAIGRELTLALLTLCVVLNAGGQAWHLEPLLAALAAGLVIENVAPARADALRDAVEQSALPVLVVFFAVAGASLNLDALATVGLAAVAVAVVRVATILAGAHVGLRMAGLTDRHSQSLWMGLVSQGGVTLGLAVLVAAEFGEWGRAVQTLVVAVIALHVLAGPILFKEALVRAGEVGTLDRALEPSSPDEAVGT